MDHEKIHLNDKKENRKYYSCIYCALNLLSMVSTKQLVSILFKKLYFFDRTFGMCYFQKIYYKHVVCWTRNISRTNIWRIGSIGYTHTCIHRRN